nr:hypothetical protein [Tanacetum cinerariifolium]
MRSEEELCPSDKGVAVNVNNPRLNLDEIHVEPLFNLTLDILKQHSIINALTLTTEAPEIYMGQVTDNLLKDPNQAIDLAKSINLEENQQREKERRSKTRHAALVLEKEVNKEVDEAYDDQMKLKLKAQKPISPATQLLLDLNDDDKTGSDKDSDHGDDTGDSDKDSDAEKDQTTEKKYALSVTKIKAAGYEQEGIDELIPHLWSLTIYKYNNIADLGIHH